MSTKASKIRMLLEKAEATDSEHEAKACFEKAQELMTLWAIDDALIQQSDRTSQEKIVTETYEPASVTYHREDGVILSAIAEHNQCRVLRITEGRRKKRKFFYIIGYENDVRRVKMMMDSVLVQVVRAIENKLNEKVEVEIKHDDEVIASLLQKSTPTFRSTVDTTEFRKSFRIGFARGLRDKLEEAYNEAIGEYTPVLASRLTDVDKYVDEEFNPKSSVSRKRKFDPIGYSSGVENGRNADVHGNVGSGVRGALKG